MDTDRNRLLRTIGTPEGTTRNLAASDSQPMWADHTVNAQDPARDGKSGCCLVGTRKERIQNTGDRIQGNWMLSSAGTPTSSEPHDAESANLVRCALRAPRGNVCSSFLASTRTLHSESESPALLRSVFCLLYSVFYLPPVTPSPPGTSCPPHPNGRRSTTPECSPDGGSGTSGSTRAPRHRARGSE
jgi:hypothetical protein